MLKFVKVSIRQNLKRKMLPVNGGEYVAQLTSRGKRKAAARTEERVRLRLDQQERDLDLEIQCQAMQEMLGELEESRSRYARLYDYSPVRFATFDDKGLISDVNLAGAALLGKERSLLIGSPMATFVDKDSVKPFFDHLRSCRLTGKQVITDLILSPKNAAPFPALIISFPPPGAGDYGLQYMSIIVDITERKFMEKELLRLESLNLIGEMAAGIAHEVRNPMTIVRGFIQLFTRKREFTPYEAQLNLMITELDRANAIITEYLSLAKNKPLNKSPHSLNRIVEGLMPLMESDALHSQKWIVSQLSDNIPELFLDIQEMRQLILNFVRNGLEAMLSGERLTIGTFAKGHQVVLFIQDQGTGIPPEVMSKLGTPFFTTKANGTGLGLSICYSIAHRHNAQIDVKTGDSGTTFSVNFQRP